MTSRLLPSRWTFHTPRVIVALILREMSTTYGRSIGGYFWAIAQPVAGIMLLTLVFSLVMRSPPIGTSFALFYATGLLPFSMYNTVQSKVSASVKFSKPLLVYPRVSYLDAVVARFILNGLTQIVVAYLLLSYFTITAETRTIIDFRAVALSIFMAFSLGFGIGTLNCLLFSVFPTWSQIWSVLNRPMFLVSGIFFLFESLPRQVSDLLWFNPLIHVTAQMRAGFYPTYNPEFVSVVYVEAFAAVPCVIGLYFLRRYHKKILNEL